MNRLVSFWNDTLTLSLPFLIIGFMAGFVHLPILLFFFVFLLVSMNRMELCISVLLIFPSLLGTAFRLFSFNIPGSIIPVFFVLLVLHKKALKIFYHNKIPLFFTITIVCFFILHYYFTGKTEYSDKKIVELCTTSITYFIAFSLITTSTNIDVKLIGKLFFVYGLILASIGVDLLGYAQFSGIFDFTSFREASKAMRDLDIVSISYHSVGIAGITGLAFLMSSAKNNKIDFFIIPAFVWLILMSGLRQALVAALLVFFLKYIVNHRRINIIDVTKWIIIIILIVFALLEANIETINSVFDSKASAGERLNRNYDYPFMIMEQHFLQGIGFGNYDNVSTMEVYPHNIILEILCEMGFLGFFFLSLLVFLFLARNRFSLRYQLCCGSFAIMIYAPYLVRSCISDSIGHNISVFIILFTLYFRNNNKTVYF